MPVTKSPLRYPGGKTQLTPFVHKTIEYNQIENCTYIEPFSGGAGVAIELLLTNKVKRIVLNDYDKSIYSVWYTILNNPKKLIKLINETDITIENWYKQKDLHEQFKNKRNSIENAFSTLFLNRTNRSGIISAGPIGGYKQDGNYKLDCRFNKQSIIEKIEAIHERKADIDLYQKDTVKLIEIIKEKYSPEDSFIFFDPPYYIQGNKLYTNFYIHKDHVSLAESIASLKNYYWITTYDNAPQIHEIYSAHKDIKSFEYALLYSAQTKRRAIEYMFSSEITKLNSFHKVLLETI